MCLPGGSSPTRQEPYAEIGRWTELGPRVGGRLDGLLVVPSFDRTEDQILVASPGGGLWFRHLTERIWRRADNVGLGDFVLVDIQQDVLDPDRIYGVGWNRLYDSLNHGASWRYLAGPRFAAPLPRSSGIIDRGRPFAQLAVNGGGRFLLYAPPCAGVCSSNEDGEDFSCSLVDEANPTSDDNCVANIAADPSSGYVWISTHYPPGTIAEPAHVYRSTFRCVAGSRCPPRLLVRPWTPATDGLPVRDRVAALEVISEPDAAEPRLAALVTRGGHTTTYTTLPGSVGLRWQAGGVTNEGGPRRILYPGFGTELIQGNVLVHYSPDFGTTWDPRPDGGMGDGGGVDGGPPHLELPCGHGDYRALFLKTEFDQYPILWAANDGANAEGFACNLGFWTWAAGSDPPVAPFEPGTGILPDEMSVWQTYYALPVVLGDGRRRVLVGSQDNFGGCFDDALGMSGAPQYSFAGAPRGVRSGDFYAMVYDRHTGRGYARGNSNIVARTDDMLADSCAGIHWTNTANEVPSHLAVTASRSILAIDPRADQWLYTLTGQGVVLSRDGGDDWGPIRPTPAPPTALAVDVAGNIIVGTSGAGAWLSPNQGRSWRRYGLNDSSPESVLAIAFGQPLPGPALIATNWLGTTRGLFRRTGLAWHRVFPPIPEGIDVPLAVSAIATDPTCRTRVYIGVGYSDREMQHGLGVFYTTTDGDTWHLLGSFSDVDRAPVTSIEIDPIDPDRLYVATYGRGAWWYDWQGHRPACVR